MKKIITLGICLFFFSTSFGQKLDYDHDSKWFFGFNVGGTWNTTDVKNKTNLGWGLILGRSFNYNYGKKISYDLRLRYLGGNWYGQDYDTTNVLGNSKYDPSGFVKQLYDTTKGYTINNFNTEAHELGLELVIHINSLREKTGWDPYIFGGAGLVWSKTLGDLYYGDSLLGKSIYNYPADGMSKSQWNQMSDDIYDSPLDGSKTNYSVSVVPNIGIGLAYQVGPKFSIGLEHRTMFYLKNTFDGYAGSSLKWGMQNDIYHYSGLVMKFQIGKKNTDDIVREDPPVDCKSPKISLRKPNQRSITVQTQNYNFEAIIDNITGRENIELLVNGSQSTNFVYNQSTRKVESQLLLNLGSNEIVLKATNACGTDEVRYTIDYVNCIPPTVNITNPSSASITVDKPSFVLNATVANSDNVEYQINGLASSNYILTGNNFSSTLNLREGINSIRIIARNECGTDEKTVNIEYKNCTIPAITMRSGTGRITVNEPVYSMSADILYIVGKPNVQFKVNGTSRDFTFNVSTKLFQTSVALTPGTNTLEIIATNDCGNDSETVTVEYAPCVNPVVAFVQPVGTTTVNTTTHLIKVQIQNINNVSQVQVKVNGTVRTGGTYNPSTSIFEYTVPLNDGNNSVEVKATNACGSETKSVIIIKSPCVGPQITMVAPASQSTSVQSNMFVFKTVVSNVTSANQIKLFLNGISMLGGTYNAGTKVFQKSLTLSSGANQIKIVATNDCSTQDLSYTVNYTPCIAPVVAFSPAPSGTTENSVLQISARVQNITSPNQVLLTLNGTSVVGGTYNSGTQIFSASLNLREGVNTVVVKGANDCGTNQATTTIIYKPCLAPQVSFSPAPVSTTQNSVVQISARVQNITAANQVLLTVNGTSVAGGTYNSGTQIFTASLTLRSGANTIVVKATTPCGTNQSSASITYAPCLSPVVTITSPVARNTESSEATTWIRAKVMNVTQVNQITLTVNGTVVTGGTFNVGTQIFEKEVNLTSGVNNVVVKAQTDCGQSEASVAVSYAPCVAPTITVVKPSGPTGDAPLETFQVVAQVLNITSPNQITLTVNGVVASGGTYNSVNGAYKNTIAVVDAISTVVISVVNECGEASKSFVLKHASPCTDPTITLLAPTSMTTTDESVAIRASIMNVVSANKVELIVNGVAVAGGTLNTATGIFEKTIPLNLGGNTVKIIASNECGTTKYDFTVTRNESQGGVQVDPGSGEGIGIGGSGGGGHSPEPTDGGKKGGK